MGDKRLKDSGLEGLKATVKHCPECGKSTVHYSAPGGWPICHACGYNAELEKLAGAVDRQQERKRKRWPWDR